VTAPDHANRYYGNNEGDVSPPSAEGAYTRRHRRRRRWIITLVVVVGLLFATDRIAAAVTESRLASKIQTSQKLSQKPSVSIGGFPFLTQVISRHFGHATVDIHDLDTRGVPISHIHADLRGVHVSSGYNSATVDDIASTGTLTYEEVSATLTRDARVGQIEVSEGAGNNKVDATYRVLGTAVSADVDVKLLTGNVLEFKAVGYHSAAGGLTLGANPFDVKISLAEMPFGLKLTGIDTTSSGMDISAVGHDVTLTGSSVALTN
jgi:hypothetical protein